MAIDVAGCAATAAGAAKQAAMARVIKRLIFFLHVEEVMGAESRRRRLASLCHGHLDNKGFRQ
jgi:hypothetical protein